MRKGLQNEILELWGPENLRMTGHLLRDDTSAFGSLRLRRAGSVVDERPHTAGMNTEHLTSLHRCLLLKRFQLIP